MPELPEVQTVVDGLNNKVLGREIESLEDIRLGTVQYFIEEDIDLGKIQQVERQGKYILLHTSAKLILLVHLRMTGKLVFEPDHTIEPGKHVTATINFNDGTRLIFDDVRTFGKIQIYNETDSIPSLQKLGVEPLSKSFDDNYLKNILRKKSAPIKNVLLDQHLVAGLGNIYVAEILFRAGIIPQREANKVTKSEIKKIVVHTKDVLKEALLHNGTTISDYRSIDDKTGEFQNFLRVYQKKTCSCGAEIKNVKLAGRSSFYCEKCQK